jgi:glycosyltransferase involved in cell wall biosynthesis
MKALCDCIIPFFNEKQQPANVVSSILNVKGLKNIIVVDDGSSDRSAFLKIKSKFPTVKLIRLEKNSGKANAVFQGFQHVKSDYTFLIDGDLFNIIPLELERAIQKISDNTNIDMIILPLVADILGVDLFRWYNILSGQRILKTNDLIKVYLQNKPTGFQLEAAINYYMIKNHKKVFWLPSSIHNTSKYRKWGRKEGIIRVFTLIKEFANYTGWWNLIYQTLFFCRREAF